MITRRSTQPSPRLVALQINSVTVGKGQGWSRMVKVCLSMSKYVKVKFQNVSKIFRLSWRLKRILTWEAVHQPLVLNCLWRAVDCEIRHALLCPRERMRYIKSVLQVSSPKVQKYPKVEIVTPCKVILVKTLKASEEVAA